MPAETLPLRFLRAIPFFRAIKDAELRRLADLSNVREVSKGKLIFSKAENAGHMFVVTEGRVKIFIHSNSRKRKTFAYLSKGAFFGEMALLGGETRSASAQAVADSKLLLISKKNFDALLKTNREMTAYLLRAVCDRLRRANQEIETLLFHNILGRLSKALWELGQSEGEKAEGGIIFTNAYTHQELADLVGTTREPLVRAISALKRAELIDVRRGRFFIKDPARLEGLGLAGS